MGKAARWFRALLGLKREESPPQPPAALAKPPRRRWSFVKSSHREKEHTIAKNATTTKERRGYSHGNVPPTTPERACGGVDPNDYAIAVATAAAAVAEAAVEAAQAATAALRMTSGKRCNAATGSSPAHVSGASCGIREERAAVKIQAHFRGCLARRALRALKGLVKLQALVRGHIVRKQTSEMLRIAQTLLRAQARARAERTQIYESPHTRTNYLQFLQHGPATPEKLEHAMRSISAKHDQSLMLKRNSSKSIGWVITDQDKAQNSLNQLDHRVDEGSWDQRGPSMKMGQTEDENSGEILDVDTGKPHWTPKRKILFQSSHHALASDHYGHSLCTSKDSSTHRTVPSPSLCEVQSLSPLKFTQDVEESLFCTADNSPQFYLASSRGSSSKGGTFAPTKSDDGSSSYLSGCSDHPSYMACTESSRAKMRSLSAPKQRPQSERSVSSTKRNLVHSNGDSRSSTQRISASFVNKAYPGSGCLNSFEMPMGGNAAGPNASFWYRS